MINLLCSYVTDKLIKNCITFGIFLLGVLLGLAIVLLIYKIFVSLKAKPPKLKKQYTEIKAKDDPVIQNALKSLHELDGKISIGEFVMSSANILVDSIKVIAEEYTGGNKYITLAFSDKEGAKPKELTFDTDFAVEDFLTFLQQTTNVLEDTVLAITDKYSVLVNSFLKFIGLGNSVRDVTVKDVVLFLNQQATKKEKKLEKAIEKQDRKQQKDQQKKEQQQQKQQKRQELQQQKQQKKKELQQQKEKKRKQRQKASKKKSFLSKSNSKLLALFKPKSKSGDNKFLALFKPKSTKKKASKNVDKPGHLRLKKKSDAATPKDIAEQIEIDEQTKISAFFKPINKVVTEIVEILIVGLCAEARKLYGRGYTQLDIDKAKQTMDSTLNSTTGGDAK